MRTLSDTCHLLAAAPLLDLFFLCYSFSLSLSPFLFEIMRVKHTAARKSTTNGPRSKAQKSPRSLQSPQSPSSSSKRKSLRNTDATPQKKKAYRRKPGTVALWEIRKFQKSFKPLIPAAPFIRTVREITHQFAPYVGRWQAEALMALQESVNCRLQRILLSVCLKMVCFVQFMPNELHS
ncbi:histone H3 type 3 isoform X2 [Beta vulgaris subsp. vulgaris]|uniref:histone H3 type 3 isoform X2 n=1 Tax=Beta vulgaris subsp. vulgaris TaxID=3555 RepID=UPI0020371648|nr:histone H3 type 3 isoform X2 [Beta vulgaris subsp. vulgaris]